MNRNLDECAIRERAHALWEAEGRPVGREEDHWHRAVLELMTPAAAAAAKPKATAARKRAKAPSTRSKAA